MLSCQVWKRSKISIRDNMPEIIIARLWHGVLVWWGNLWLEFCDKVLKSELTCFFLISRFLFSQCSKVIHIKIKVGKLWLS
jgi:hypothetical protein